MAYIAAKRKEGVGNLDIYRIDFGDDNEQPKTLYGTVLVGENDLSEEQYNESMPKAYVMVFDRYQNIVSQLDVTEEGYFFAALYPGDYTYEVKFDGQDSGFKEKIRIAPTDDESIYRTIHLKPVK